MNFEEIVGTPNNSFSFKKGAEAIGRPFDSATELQGKVQRVSLHFLESSILEAKVVGD